LRGKAESSCEIDENYLNSGSSLLFYKFTRRAIKLTAVIIEEYHFYQLHKKYFRHSLKAKSTDRKKLLGINSVGCNVTDELLVGLLAFIRYWRKNGSRIRMQGIFITHGALLDPSKCGTFQILGKERKK
jgi:hypothetical protein